MDPSAEQVSAVRQAWASGLRPEPALRVSTWADEHRRLSPKHAAESGRWRTTRTPYLREIMDALSATSPYETVVVCKGSQIGATECGNNWIGYVIDQAPGPMLAVSPTVELAKRASRQRIEPMVDETPRLAAKVREKRERDSGNTLLAKEFPKGVLVLTGANSAVGLRSMPARYLFLDEVDAYPVTVDEEGDPVSLARRATRTFRLKRKELVVSTPLVRGASAIERELAACDIECAYHVPCPSCGHLQPLVWAQMKWPEKQPALAHYVCIACEATIEERHKATLLPAGEWVRVRDKMPAKSIGFRLSSLYSPLGWFSWAEAAAMFARATETHSRELLRYFVNTVLGESFVEHGEAPEWRRLYDQREDYPLGVVPAGGLFLVAGADVQKDRIEVEVVAYGRGKESWSVDYRVLEGDPAGPRVWQDLERVILQPDWPTADGGTLPIRVLAVDAGYATQHVSAFVRRYPQPSYGPAGASARVPRTVIAIIGRAIWGAPIQTPKRADVGATRAGLRFWVVATSSLKLELYDWLRLPRPTDEERAVGKTDLPGTCHFPKYAEDYFIQLTAERLVTHHQRGAIRREWQLDPSRRNEALDCRVYARAAAELFGLSRFTPRQWREVERAGAGAVTPGRSVPETPSVPTPAPAAPLSGRGVRGRFEV